MFIYSNLATSLDGKIASADRRHFYLGTPADRRQMQVLRKRADAILVGASTLRAFKEPMRAVGRVRPPLNVVLSSELAGISPKWEFFRDPKVERLLFTGPEAPASRIRALARLAPRPGIASQIVSELARRGVKRLLVEGGGGVMWDFVRENLIDEFHVTLTPWILGGSRAPTLVDGHGFPSARGQKLKLVRSRRLGHELYLVYRRV